MSDDQPPKRLKTSAVPSSGIMERLKAFLPKVACANAELTGKERIDADLVPVVDATQDEDADEDTDNNDGSGSGGGGGSSDGSGDYSDDDGKIQIEFAIGDVDQQFAAKLDGQVEDGDVSEEQGNGARHLHVLGREVNLDGSDHEGGDEGEAAGDGHQRSNVGRKLPARLTQMLTCVEPKATAAAAAPAGIPGQQKPPAKRCLIEELP